MKPIKESLDRIQQTINTIKNEAQRKKAQEEFDKLPKDPSLYQIKAYNVDLGNIPAATDPEIVFESYAKKAAENQCKFYSNSHYELIKIDDARFECVIKDGQNNVLEKTISDPKTMLYYHCSLEKNEKQQKGENEPSNIKYLNDIRQCDSYDVDVLDNDEDMRAVFRCNHIYENSNATWHVEKNLLKKEKTVHTEGISGTQEIYNFNATLGKENNYIILNSKKQAGLGANLRYKSDYEYETIVVDDGDLIEHKAGEKHIVENDQCAFLSKEIEVETRDEENFKKTTTLNCSLYPNEIDRSEEIGKINNNEKLSTQLSGQVISSTNDLSEAMQKDNKQGNLQANINPNSIKR